MYFLKTYAVPLYLCLRAAQRPTTVNGFLALQPPHIVQYRLSQCQLVSEHSEGLTPSDSPAHTGPATNITHTHTHIHNPLAPHPLPSLSAASDIDCHGDISQPRWHGDPPIT